MIIVSFPGGPHPDEQTKVKITSISNDMQSDGHKFAER
jgi:hypothetical protein